MSIKILTEASGSLTAGYLIKAVKEAGCISVASDIDSSCAGRFLADDFIEMPGKNDPELWNKILAKIKEHKINLVLPSFDETLLGWAERKQELSEQGICVILSGPKVVKIFQDKWLTYQFFKDNGIPTPASSLEQKYPLVKPRIGRGSSGVRVVNEQVDMTGLISQELVEGEEYTVDVLCDNESRPIYVIPRKRLGVKEGKSTGGVVVKHPGIEQWVAKICSVTPFIGPINIQCFVCPDETIKFIEINTRIAGGMALGFAATENWIRPLVENVLDGKPIIPKAVQYGMEMKRYYAEIFIPPS